MSKERRKPAPQARTNRQAVTPASPARAPILPPIADAVPQQEWPRETAVIPTLTLPTRAIPPTAGASGSRQRMALPDGARNATSAAQRAVIPAHTPVKRNNTLASMPVATAPTMRRSRVANITRRVIPGRAGRRVAPGSLAPEAGIASKVAGQVRRHKALVTAITLVVVVMGLLADATGVGQLVGLPDKPWQVLGSGIVAPTPTPRPAPSSLDPWHYVAAYGFDYPRHILSISADERQRLAFMLPFALRATAAFDARYHASIEPELVVWWTHAEGISGHINYSNCANHPPRAGTNYFSNIENCPQANFWQLGYGNQFSVIYVLKSAFTDLYGDPSDTKLVQKVGQWVLDFDRRQGTTPPCGGYSCTFPALTIDQIMAGINEATGVMTADNWWASVLSRDPAINCYMIAQALTFFNHDATRSWVGCYYAEPCWGNESDRLGDILSAWPGLRQAAGV